MNIFTNVDPRSNNMITPHELVNNTDLLLRNYSKFSESENKSNYYMDKRINDEGLSIEKSHSNRQSKIIEYKKNSNTNQNSNRKISGTDVSTIPNDTPRLIMKKARKGKNSFHTRFNNKVTPKNINISNLKVDLTKSSNVFRGFNSVRPIRTNNSPVSTHQTDNKITITT